MVALTRPAAAAPPAEPDSRELVRAVEAYYRHATTLKANFLEQYREGHREIRVESGSVYFSRPGRMRWEYESPETKLFIIDGKTVWFYVPADHTVTRARVRESADWRTPLAWLTGKVKLSRLCGGIQQIPPKAAGAGGSRQNLLLRCVPRGAQKRGRVESDSPAGSLSQADQDWDEVILEVDPVTGWLAGIAIRQPAGVEIVYRFNNWEQNLPLPQSLFHFQAPPGVAIVDESVLSGRTQ